LDEKVFEDLIVDLEERQGFGGNWYSLSVSPFLIP